MSFSFFHIACLNSISLSSLLIRYDMFARARGRFFWLSSNVKRKSIIVLIQLKISFEEREENTKLTAWSIETVPRRISFIFYWCMQSNMRTGLSRTTANLLFVFCFIEIIFFVCFVSWNLIRYLEVRETATMKKRSKKTFNHSSPTPPYIYIYILLASFSFVYIFASLLAIYIYWETNDKE